MNSVGRVDPPLTAWERFWVGVLPKIRPTPVADVIRRALGIRRRTVTTPNGKFHLDPLSDFGSAFFRSGTYEEDLGRALRDLLPEGGVFVDLGANEGFFSVVAARRVGPVGVVVAVEPQTRLLPVIRTNCELNGVESIVRVENVAVSDRKGEAQLFLAPKMNTGSSGLIRPTRYRLPTQTVRIERLADLLDRMGITMIDLLKIDIEGFEYEAVLGSPEVFEAGRIRALALEYHPSVLAARGRPMDDIGRFLMSCGYRQDERYSNTVYLLRSG